MLPYCLKCNNNTENVDPKVLKIKNCRTTLSSKSAVCSSKKSKSMKEQETNGLLSSLGIKTPLSNITGQNIILIVLDTILF